jgi:hypothetical protein
MAALPNAFSQREIDGGLVPAIEHACFQANQGPEIEWRDVRLASIIRLRLVADGPIFTVLYCHGVMTDGRYCRVKLPFTMLRKKTCREELLEYARRSNVNAVQKGLFRALSTAE